MKLLQYKAAEGWWCSWRLPLCLIQVANLPAHISPLSYTGSLTVSYVAISKSIRDDEWQWVHIMHHLGRRSNTMVDWVSSNSELPISTFREYPALFLRGKARASSTSALANTWSIIASLRECQDSHGSRKMTRKAKNGYGKAWAVKA